MNESGLELLQGTGSLIFLLVLHLVWSYPIYVMAKRTNTPNEWLAFIPIAQYFLLAQVGGKEIWWGVLMLIPCINIIAMVIIWMAVAERMEKPSWFGVLMLIPCVNLVVPWLIAFN